MNTHRKGWAWRRKVEMWFEEAGFRTTTRGIGYSGDDIFATQPENCTGIGAPGLNLSVECKNAREITLAAFVDQAERQARTYPAEDGVLPVAIIHRKGKAAVDDGYVVLPGWAFIELVTR